MYRVRFPVLPGEFDERVADGGVLGVEDPDPVLLGEALDNAVHEAVAQPDLVGGKHLERRDAGRDGLGDLVEDRRILSGDRTVETEVDERVASLVLLAFDPLQQRPLLVKGAHVAQPGLPREVDIGGRPADRRGARRALVGVLRELVVDVDVDVHDARQHQLPRGVDRLFGFRKRRRRTDRDDLTVVDADARVVLSARTDDRPASNRCINWHVSVSRVRVLNVIYLIFDSIEVERPPVVAAVDEPRHGRRPSALIVCPAETA